MAGWDSALRNLIDDTVKHTGPASDFVGKELNVIDMFTREAIGHASQGMDAAGRLDLESAGSAIASHAAVSSMFASIGVSFALHYAHDLVLTALYHMSPVISGRSARYIAGAFDPSDWFDLNLHSHLYDAPNKYIHNYIHATGWGAKESGVVAINPNVGGAHPPLAAPAPAAPGRPAPASPLQSEVNSLAQQVSNISIEVAALQRAIGQIHPAPGTDPQLVAQLRHLQRQMSTVAHDLDNLNERAVAQAKAIDQLAKELGQLRSEMTGLRAVEASWPEVLEQLRGMQAQVQKLEDNVQPAIHHVQQQVTGLSPLGLLLQPGLAGLRVLRQLEDTPCMCPKFGGIPNEWGTALALMEFIENG